MENNLTCSPKEAADALGCSLHSVYEGIRRGQIPALEFGRLKRVPRSWLKKIAEGGKVAAQ